MRLLSQGSNQFQQDFRPLKPSRHLVRRSFWRRLIQDHMMEVRGHEDNVAAGGVQLFH